MEVKWDRNKEEYYTKEPIGKQTFYMSFQRYCGSTNTYYFNIYMSLYTKRKHIDYNENNILSTGLNPMETIILAIKSFNILEKEIIEKYGGKNRFIIFCLWTDNKRRDVYYKFLSKKGYKFMMIDGQKCIGKVFEN